MTISVLHKKQFQKKVLDRYEANKRDLPWRQTQDPYKIMVSEFMLQQTQVPRVIQKFARWMELRPTVQDLASASRADVLREWSWLWFNRRAINLHESAKKIASSIENGEKKDSSLRSEWLLLDESRWDGSEWLLLDESRGDGSEWLLLDESKWDSGEWLLLDRSKWDSSEWVLQNKYMSDYAFLRSLPWVGEYTANAILAFAYNQEVAVIDINIKRVLIHSFELPVDMPQFELQELALSLVPHWKSCDWHNALMDYWSQVLHSKATWIRSAKQSTFAWSDREVRGWILKQLALQPSISIITISQQRPDKNVENIVAGLCKEWMLVMQGMKLRIAD